MDGMATSARVLTRIAANRSSSARSVVPRRPRPTQRVDAPAPPWSYGRNRQGSSDSAAGAQSRPRMSTGPRSPHASGYCTAESSAQ